MIGTTTRKSMRLTQVLLIESQPNVRRTLSQFIAHEKDLAVCGEAEDVTHAMEMPDDVMPDIAVLDLALADGDGVELAHRIRQRWSSVRIIMICACGEALSCADMVEVGAMGIVSKHEASEQIVEAIRSAMHGHVFCGELVDHAASHWFG
ncbi:MAG: response regulator transcription factor [Phycisphaeraceae bacterium]